MFGIVFLLLMMIVWLATGIKTYHDNHQWNKESKEEAIKKGKDCYLTCDGAWHDMKTGINYVYETDSNGDRWKVGAVKGDRLENVSEKRRQKFETQRKAEAVANGSKFYVKSVGTPDPNRDYTKGKRMNVQCFNRLTRVANIDTGEEYFRANRGDVYLYQNLDTGMFDYYEIQKSNPFREIREDSPYVEVFEGGEVHSIKKNELNEYLQRQNEEEKKRIQDGIKWYGNIERAMELYGSIWG